MNMIILQTLLLSLPSAAALAGQVSPVDCENITHSQQVHQCAGLARQDAHEAWRHAFIALNGRVGRQWQADADLRKEVLEQIEGAQRLWFTSSKADCALESFDIEQGTQAYEATFDACITQRYQLREAYLNGLMTD